MQNRTWDTLTTQSRLTVEREIVPLYYFMEQERHKYKRGFTSPKMFAKAVLMPSSTDYFPSTPEGWDQFSLPLSNKLARWKRQGFLYYRQEVPNGPKVWSVNEAILPPGTVNYTGVRHTIPLRPEDTLRASPTQLEPKEKPKAEMKTERDFLEAELKLIKVQKCVLGQGRSRGSSLNTHAEIELKDITLWDIYQVGLALQKTLGTEFSRQPEDREEEDGEETNPEQQSEKGVSDTIGNNVSLPVTSISHPDSYTGAPF